MSDRAPVVVGISQLLQRVDDPAAARAPLALMKQAILAAADDTRVPEILRRVSSLRVVKGMWGYKNPALEIIHALDPLDRDGIETAVSVLGGNHVQMMVNQSALDILEGRHDAIVLTGAECGRTLGRAQKAGVEIDWLEEQTDPSIPDPDVVYGTSKWTRHEAEMARGIQRPSQYYAMFEIALRHRNGETAAQHLERVSKLWAGFSSVAQNNPHAWIRREVSAEEIRTITSANRWISFPYPKLMNANMRVDMGAALILCSSELADILAIDELKRVYPLSGTDAYDHYFVSERHDLHSSPAIRIAGGRALELAQVEADELDHVDLYSCFPSAVQVAAGELGLSLDRPLTVTGGLTFGGGPLNNYVMHSIARTVELLRESSDGSALVTANGGMLTKHSFGVYGKAHPDRDFRHENLQAEVALEPKRQLADENHAGPAAIESYTVVFGTRDQRSAAPTPATTRSYASIYGKAMADGSEPVLAHLACLLEDGRRAWANLEDETILDAMCHEEFCGRQVLLDGKGGASVL